MLLNERQAGICGGTLSGLLPLVSSDELFHTLILAGAGAIISFFVSYFLQKILPRQEEDTGKRKWRR